MRPSAKSLALRDPAAAALMGVDADFGNESDFGMWGSDWGDDTAAPMTVPNLTATPLIHPAVAAPLHRANTRPSAAQAMDAWQQHNLKQAHTAARVAQLEPNGGSDVKIGRFSLSINTDVTLGTSVAINQANNPSVNFRPQLVTTNDPTPGFEIIDSLAVANLQVTVGGSVDGFSWSAYSQGRSLDMPTISPANKVTKTGSYTGFVPPGFIEGNSYKLCTTLTGPATMVPHYDSGLGF